jgi:hypothetical protein
LRKIIIDKKNNYLQTPAEIGKELQLPRTAVQSICKKFDETGRYEVSPQTGRPTIWTDEMKKFDAIKEFNGAGDSRKKGYGKTKTQA